MSQDEKSKLIAQARSGDLEAIATVLRHQFKKSDLRIQVSQRHHYLGILLEATELPECSRAVQIISQCSEKLKLKGIKGLRIFGRAKDKNVLIWRRDVDLTVKALKQDHLSLLDWMSQGTGGQTVEPTGGQKPFQLPSKTNDAEAINRRYLRFYFGIAETALIPLDRIDEVLQVTRESILPMPNMPESVVGICNCRGGMLWLVDLGQQLGFPSSMAGMLEIVAVVVVREAERRIGLVVPHIVDIESYMAQDLRSPTKELFLPNLLQFMEGYLTRSSSPVLDVRAIASDPRLQVHSYGVA
jgi:positive phototaxis protein PixI